MDREGHWYFAADHKGPDWMEEDYLAWKEFAKSKEAHETELELLNKLLLSLNQLGMIASFQM